MKRSLGIFTLCIAFSTAASAQETAELVQTSGTAELKRASEAMIAQASQSISIRLPTTVKRGEIISIQYEGKGNSVADSFMVTGITIKDGACAIENKRHTTAGSALSDMIHARPCKKLK
ncbi:MAG: hypothetical protein FD157_2523 [Rhodocyclaceae bacterium]|nr:MAG: hypothetical protein FD157_2523 [Rhodocyclaceae bacterium]TND00160.1 MAG: hypothetical protein FD118_3344 [Rhodocyclaceae bacterium]